MSCPLKDQCLQQTELALRWISILCAIGTLQYLHYINELYFKFMDFMVAETALQVPLTCDIPQIASNGILRSVANVLKSATKVLSQALGQSCNLSLVVTKPGAGDATSKDQTMLVNDRNLQHLHRTHT